MKSLFSPERIEQDLHRLQMEASPYGARTTLFNLVVFTRNEFQEQAEDIYSGLFGKRTARIIHINRTGRAESRVSVSARCRDQGDQEAICFQEVLIECGKDEIGVSPGAWTPLLLRDIPVFVLWLDRVVGNEDVIAAAIEHADKIIFDSDFLASQQEPIGELLRVYLDQVVAEGVLPADLAWLRGLPLRKLTAWAFNHEDSLPLLDTISRIHINGAKPATAQLFLLWLAERMQYEIAGEGLRTPDGSILSTEHHNPAPLEDGVEITIDLKDDRQILLTGGANGCGEIDIPGVRSLPRVFSIMSDADMLQMETDYLYGDSTFLPALRQLYQHH